MMVYRMGDRSIFYLAQPRTASRSTTTLLKMIGFHRVKSVGFHSCIPRLFNPNDVVITTVRNHHDWIASYYRMFGTGQPFNVWVNTVTRCKGTNKIPWVKQIDQVWKVFWSFTPYANVIWRFETLQQNLNNTLRCFFPSQNLSLPVIGKRPCTQQYTPEAFDYVAMTFLKERQKYGYAL